MKFFLNFFDKLQNRPSYKFFLNLFPLKNNQYYSIKQLNYIQIFYKLKNFFKIKFFKFNYSYYNIFIVYVFLFNLLSQLFILLIINVKNNENIFFLQYVYVQKKQKNKKTQL